jgi:hypothetical protein
MVGRLWQLDVPPARAAEFEQFSSDSALPLVRGKMGCSAVFVLREGNSPRYALLAFWISRKAMAVALASSEWRLLQQSLEEFGLTTSQAEGIAYESLAFFLSGEKPEAPSAPRGA